MKKSPRGWLLLAGLVVLGVGGAGYWFILQPSSSQDLRGDIVATVGDREITAAEFRAYMALRGGGNSGYFSSPDRIRDLLDELIDREWQIAQALDSGYASDPEVLETMERVILRRYREDHLDQLLTDVSVNDADVRAVYESRLESHTRPAMVRVAMIQVGRPGSADEDDRIRALVTDLQRQATQSAGNPRAFAALAARHSEHQASRYAGGDMGWYTMRNGEAVAGQESGAEILAAVSLLDASAPVSDVVVTRDYYAILKRLDYRPERVAPFEEAAPGIRLELLAANREKVEQDWIAAQRDDGIPVEINQPLLETLRPEQGATAQDAPPEAPGLPNG